MTGITRVPVVFVNAYLVDIPDGSGDWVLVDTGLPGAGSTLITQAAAARYGAGRPPRAIVLTHGHFDHAGSAHALAHAWGAPVFAHWLELPYLTGQSDYPPGDPTVGGALAMMSRAFPRGGRDLGSHVRPLPTDGSVPHLPGWRVVQTPGHTPGHISLIRDDGALLAGDALTTQDQEVWSSLVVKPRELHGPPAPLTYDWGAAVSSLQELARLRPTSIAAGHGLPIEGGLVADAFETFARTFAPPPDGRYVRQPLLADDHGLVRIPPPVPDPVGVMLRAVAVTAAIGSVVMLANNRRRA